MPLGRSRSSPAPRRSHPPSFNPYYKRPSPALLISCELDVPGRLKPNVSWYVRNVFGESQTAFDAYYAAFLAEFPLSKRPANIDLQNVKAVVIRQVCFWLRVPGCISASSHAWDGLWPDDDDDRWGKDKEAPRCKEADMTWAELFKRQIDERVLPWAVWTLCLLIWNLEHMKLRRRVPKRKRKGSEDPIEPKEKKEISLKKTKTSDKPVISPKDKKVSELKVKMEPQSKTLNAEDELIGKSLAEVESSNSEASESSESSESSEEE